jgi:hypothetical protein
VKGERWLICAVDGARTHGEQWPNRDTGFGLCADCAAWLRKRGMGEDEIRRLYGVEGVNFPAPAKEVSK